MNEHFTRLTKLSLSQQFNEMLFYYPCLFSRTRLCDDNRSGRIPLGCPPASPMFVYRHSLSSKVDEIHPRRSHQPAGGNSRSLPPREIHRKMCLIKSLYDCTTLFDRNAGECLDHNTTYLLGMSQNMGMNLMLQTNEHDRYTTSDS